MALARFVINKLMAGWLILLVLGEHTDDILAGLGYSAPQIAALREAGAVG